MPKNIEEDLLDTNINSEETILNIEEEVRESKQFRQEEGKLYDSNNTR